MLYTPSCICLLLVSTNAALVLPTFIHADSRRQAESQAQIVVRQACRLDVDELCLGRPKTLDQVLDPLLFVDDLSRWMDAVINEALLIPVSTIHTVMPSEEVQMSHFLTMLSAGLPDQSPDWVADQVVQHGMARMADESDVHRRLARRLSEVTAKDVEACRKGVFGDTKVTTCMYSHFSKGTLSMPCGQAMIAYEHAKLQTRQVMQTAVIQHELFAISRMILLYVMVLISVSVNKWV
jgi:hypothetical protein